jgi:hypothetical protein
MVIGTDRLSAVPMPNSNHGLGARHALLWC